MTPESLPSGQIMSMERLLAAPREAVFHAWTDAAAFARWFGPHDVEVPICELDARPGGRIRFCHRLPDRAAVWIQGRFDELVPPSRLVFTMGFVNEAWQPAPHPDFPDWSVDVAIVTTVTLADAAEGTWLTVASQLTPQTPEMRQLFEMTRLGWTETLERLTAFLDATMPEQP